MVETYKIRMRKPIVQEYWVKSIWFI